MRYRVGLQRTEPLSAGEVLARRGDISPVQSRAGLRGADQGCDVAGFDPGLAQRGVSLSGELLGQAPLAARHGQQRPLAQRSRENLVCAGVLPDADRVLQECVTFIEVTGQDARHALEQRGSGRHDALRGEPVRRLPGVGAHLPDPAPTHEGPQQGGPSGHRRILKLTRVLVLPAVDQIGPPLGLAWPPHPRVDERGQHSDHGISLDALPVIQPPEPLPEGGDPALPAGRHREFFHQAGCRLDVPCGDGILQCLLGHAIAQAPAGRAAPQHRQVAGFTPFQLRQEHVAEQVMVEVPLSSPV